METIVLVRVKKVIIEWKKKWEEMRRKIEETLRNKVFCFGLCKFNEICCKLLSYKNIKIFDKIQ